MPYGINQQSDLSVASTLTPRIRTALETGSTVDMANFFRASIVVQVGAISAVEIHTLFLQESTDNSTFTNIASASLNPTTAGIVLNSQSAQGIQEIEYLGSSRYLRVLTSTGGLPASNYYAAHIVRSGGRTLPT